MNYWDIINSKEWIEKDYKVTIIRHSTGTIVWEGWAKGLDSGLAINMAFGCYGHNLHPDNWPMPDDLDVKVRIVHPSASKEAPPSI